MLNVFCHKSLSIFFDYMTVIYFSMQTASVHLFGKYTAPARIYE